MNDATTVAVVGAGQAGLSCSYFLTAAGVSHVVLERDVIGQSWRKRRWNAFKLNTPNSVNNLPGMEFDKDHPDTFGNHLAFVDYLERYARANALPVEVGATVTSVKATLDQKGFRVEVDRGGEAKSLLEADHVIAATGSFIEPKRPELAARLPPSVEQIPAANYRSPGDLPAGAVLVVGSGDSGCQIAEDLVDAGREVYLAISRRERLPRRYRGRDNVDWAIAAGRWDITRDTLDDERAVDSPDTPLVSGVGEYGHTLCYQALERKGIVLLGRLLSVDGDVLTFDDQVNRYIREADEGSASFKSKIDAFIAATGLDAPDPEFDPEDQPDDRAGVREIILALDMRAKNIRTVLWCTGFTHDFSWLQVPVFDGNGRPVHDRGVAPVEGIYFCGLHWLHTRASGFIWGTGRDAEHVTQIIRKRIAARSGQ